MDFRLTPEQEQFRESVTRFAEKHLAKGARERAHSPDYPFDVAKLMARQGLLGITVAEADGGQGGTLIDAVIAIEAIASVNAKASAGPCLICPVGSGRPRVRAMCSSMRRSRM